MGEEKKDIEFVVLLEEMKSVYRMTKVIGTDRRENDAEHSWHVAIMSMILESHSKIKVDINKVIKMLLVHDIVEIYAGDTFAYDTKGNESKLQRELDSMAKIKSQLSTEIGDYIESLWLEFDERKSDEARYANAMDRLQPILSNIYDGRGGTWKGNNVSFSQVMKRVEPIKDFNESVYNFVVSKVQEGVEKGYLTAN